MMADNDSTIAWHKVQLKKNRDALKALEISRFRLGQMSGSSGQTEKIIGSLKRKILESQRCIAEHERRTRRPVATDLRSLSSMSWSNWNARVADRS